MSAPQCPPLLKVQVCLYVCSFGGCQPSQAFATTKIPLVVLLWTPVLWSDSGTVLRRRCTSDSAPLPAVALTHILRVLAPFVEPQQVKPICVAHQWKVPLLLEFVPKEAGLLGMNVNRGQKICIRLRPASDEGELSCCGALFFSPPTGLPIYPDSFPASSPIFFFSL